MVYKWFTICKPLKYGFQMGYKFGNIKIFKKNLWFTNGFQMIYKKKFCKPYGLQIFPIVNHISFIKIPLIIKIKIL